MMEYKRPQTETTEANLILLTASGPGATDIGSPNFDNDAKSIWDDEEIDNTLFNIREENYEDKVYE